MHTAERCAARASGRRSLLPSSPRTSARLSRPVSNGQLAVLRAGPRALRTPRLRRLSAVRRLSPDANSVFMTLELFSPDDSLPRPSYLRQLSRSVTVRLKTSAPAFESIWIGHEYAVRLELIARPPGSLPTLGSSSLPSQYRDSVFTNPLRRPRRRRSSGTVTAGRRSAA